MSKKSKTFRLIPEAIEALRALAEGESKRVGYKVSQTAFLTKVILELKNKKEPV